MIYQIAVLNEKLSYFLSGNEEKGNKNLVSILIILLYRISHGTTNANATIIIVP
jgi:hypothetical protein